MEEAYRDYVDDPEGVARRESDAVKLLNPDYKEHGIKGESIDDRFSRQAEQAGDVDFDFFPDGIEADFEAASLYRHNFQKAKGIKGVSAEAAERMAYKAVMQEYDPQFYGDDTEEDQAVFEHNSPSRVLGIDRTLTNSHHTSVVEEANTQREGFNQPKIDPESTRRVYVGKRKDPATGEMKEAWLLTDLGMTPVMRGDKYTFVTFPLVDPEKAAADRKQNQTLHMSKIRSSMDASLEGTSTELPQNGSKLERENFQIGLGRERESLREQTRDSYTATNSEEWEGYSDEEKAEQNMLFYQAYQHMMGLQQQQHMQSTSEEPFDFENTDYRIRHYLNSRGYKSMDADGNFAPPPDMY